VAKNRKEGLITMAMDSKQDFLRSTEKALGDIVTASDMNRILKALSDVLEGYEMRMIREWTEEHDDCLQCFLDALSVECRSQKTIDRYRYVIGRRMMLKTAIGGMHNDLYQYSNA
jgi:hypothetical protein